MSRTIMTKRLALGLVLAVLAVSIPPLRAEVLNRLGASDFLPHLTAADGSTAVRRS